jgi:hypothetical protein
VIQILVSTVPRGSSPCQACLTPQSPWEGRGYNHFPEPEKVESNYTRKELDFSKLLPPKLVALDSFKSFVYLASRLSDPRGSEAPLIPFRSLPKELFLLLQNSPFPDPFQG